jgi:hypothetical protein
VALAVPWIEPSSSEKIKLWGHKGWTRVLWSDTLADSGISCDRPRKWSLSDGIGEWPPPPPAPRPSSMIHCHFNVLLCVWKREGKDVCTWVEVRGRLSGVSSLLALLCSFQDGTWVIEHQTPLPSGCLTPISLFGNKTKQVMMTHSFNSSTLEPEAGRYVWAWGHLGLQSEFRAIQSNTMRACLKERKERIYLAYTYKLQLISKGSQDRNSSRNLNQGSWWNVARAHSASLPSTEPPT